MVTAEGSSLVGLSLPPLLTATSERTAAGPLATHSPPPDWSRDALACLMSHHPG